MYKVMCLYILVGDHLEMCFKCILFYYRIKSNRNISCCATVLDGITFVDYNYVI